MYWGQRSHAQTQRVRVPAAKQDKDLMLRERETQSEMERGSARVCVSAEHNAHFNNSPKRERQWRHVLVTQ